ncbi:c-type cytochrome, methanol metabolism-related [Terrihabitans sp. B22-R8]|uniref:c-type cytochrome, methanol metabolism-related n=1 Tax=Terrihabitans sp. B22-R8 TaxID=3425128 RepID=UPI00403D4FA8
MIVKFHAVAGALLAASFALTGLAYSADGSGDPAAASEEDGKFADAEGNPTFKVDETGSTDWYTYSGYRRYHAECHVCHGPAGEGSSYAPSLVQSLKTMPYADFQQIVVNGRVNVGGGHENVMPAFGTNPNVMCYLDDIYVYLRARNAGVVNRARPDKHADKPKSFVEAENACMGR